MKVQTIRKTIVINAPVTTVWDVLFNERFTNTWYETFSECTRVKTDWQEGSTVIFADNTQNGLIAKVVTNSIYDEMVLQYEGQMVNGAEDYFSRDARKIKGGIESYRLVENGRRTELFITSDMTEEHFDFMSTAWDKALLQIKMLAEAELIPA